MIGAPQQRPRHLKMERARARRTAAFEQIDRERGVCTGGQQKPQCGGRCLAARAQRPEQESQGVAAGGGKLQTPDLRGIDGCRPAQQRPQRAARQGVLGRPQRIARPAGRDHRQAREIDSPRCPGCAVQRMGRRHQQRPAPRLAQAPEYRQQQRTFAEPGAIGEDFSERAAWPATARQFGIEPGKAAGERRVGRAGQTIGAPDIGPGENFSKRGCGFHGR